MKILKLKLFTNTLALEKVFYAETLGFEIIAGTPNSFTLKIGWSELTFEKSEKEHIYHYCFLIPSNTLAQALAWMEKRVPIIDIDKGRKTQNFQSWNADSFYFHDASGTIAECIVRHDLNNNSISDFTLSDVLCINEIGMPTKDIEKINKKLHENFKTDFWKGDPKQFGTNGSQEGLFLLPNYTFKKLWFPTSIEIKPEPFEIVIENNGRKYAMAYKNEELKTMTVKAYDQ